MSAPNILMNRRAVLVGAAALGAAVATPETVWAAAAGGDWTLAVADLEADVADGAMRRLHGRAPAGLRGALFRNGPARFRRPGGDAGHWFDGDGLMRRFRIEDGEARMAARFVDTPKRRRDIAAGAMVTPGFGTPGGEGVSLSSADDSNAANTAVLPVGGKVWALWEAGSPAILDAETLETEGFATLRPDLAHMPFLAHPRIEPDGRVWNLGLSGRRAIVWRLAASGALESADAIDLPRASYVHDFTATARHLVIVLQPLMAERLVLPYSQSLAWRPDEGVTVLVLEKDDLSRRRVFELPGFAFFHLSDAWEEGDGTIRFSACVYDDPTFAVTGGADLLQGRVPASTPARLAEIALGADGSGRIERLDVSAEFPRSDPRRAGLARDLTVFAAGEGRFAHRPLPTALAVRDRRTDRIDRFDFGAGHVVEEMVYVANPASPREGDGWLVGPSINLAARATELHVFRAGRVSDGPVCSWRGGAALPAGFHGSFVAA